MPSYAIFVGFPAEDWRGPPLVNWEAGLVEKDYLALRAGDGEGGNRWVGCRLQDVERIHWCVVAGEAALPCCQAEIRVRGTGTLYVYASRPCLAYLADRGVAVAEMADADADACRTLWAELAAADDGLPAEVCGLVNAAMA
jgi:hypothetical protein